MLGQEVYLRKFSFSLSSEFCSRVWSRLPGQVVLVTVLPLHICSL